MTRAGKTAKRPRAPSRKPPGIEATGPLYIAQGLWPLVVKIDSVDLLDRNPRTHGRDSTRAIRTSLRLYGQRKPIVVNRKNGQVEAGNGMLEAARRLGWEWIAVLYVEDDQQTQHGFAIADNRTAELSEWDDEILIALFMELKGEAAGVAGELEDALLLDEVLGDEGPTRKADGQTEAVLTDLEYRIVVTCRDEAQQVALLKRLEKDGFQCQPLIC